MLQIFVFYIKLTAGSGTLFPAKWYMNWQHSSKILKIRIYSFHSMTNLVVKAWLTESNLKRNEEFLKNWWNVNRVDINYYAKI